MYVVVLLSILCSEYGKVVLERVIKLRAQSLLMDTKRGENLRREEAGRVII